MREDFSVSLETKQKELFKELSENKRNPLVQFEDKIVQFIGDPHFGRTSFKTGCLSSKIGLRESYIREEFKELLKSDSDYVVIVGDIFDKFSVGGDVIFGVYDDIKDAALTQGKKTFFIIPGNHDLSRDKTKVSSYSILKVMLEPFRNVHVIEGKPLIYSISDNWTFIFDSFSHFDKAFDIDKYDLENQRIAYIGHWSDVRFLGTDSEKEHSYLPNPILLDRADILISGHIHIPFNTTYEGRKMFYIGSLQPYTFGEDEDGDWYIRVHYRDLEKAFSSSRFTKYSPNSFSKKHLKIDAPVGYVFPHSIDCLSLIYNPIKTSEEKKENLEGLTNPDNIFDFKLVFMNKLEELNINKNLRDQIKDILNGDQEDIKLDLSSLVDEED